MKKKLVITLTIICIIAGGYIAMKYVEKKNKKSCFGRNKKHEWKSTFVIM